MEKILVVSSNKTASEALVNFLRDSFRCTPKLVESAYQAKTVFDADPSVELRAADCVCDPYFVLGLMIYAALEGISEKLPLPEKNTGSERLPSTLEEAVACTESSEFVKKYVPANILEVLLKYSREEWREYSSAYDKEAFE